jgi:membrane-associated phospholipid phosphatase
MFKRVNMLKNTPKKILNNLRTAALIASSLAISSFSNENKTDIQKAGDLFLLLLPAAAYGNTYLQNDSVGRDQFYNGFTTTLGTTYLLKYSVDAKRPDNNGEHSFPSGHAALTFHSAAFIHQRYGLDYAIPAYITASFVAWSRIDSKQHYTKDVVAGAAIGTISGFYFTSPYKNSTIVPIIQNDAVGLQLTYKW